MFRFANIEMLWWLVTIPVFVIGYVVYTHRKRRQLTEFGDSELMAQLMPDASKSRPVVKFGILMFALALLIVAVARPQYGQKEKSVKRQGCEVMVALDISNSMLAEDVSPNRLDRAKQMLSKMMDGMVDDKVGLIVFAGEAFTQLPITCDYVSAKMFLNTISPSLIATQGTAIGAALQRAIVSFGEQESDAGRAIILITDGENHEDDAIAAANKARELGIKVLVVGIGKPEGSPIPRPGTNDYFKDRSGQVVVSRLNEEMCQQIAQAGDGVYVRADNSNIALRTISKQLSQLQQGEIQSAVYADYADRFYIFAWIALFILILEFFILNRQNKQLNKYKWFE